MREDFSARFQRMQDDFDREWEQSRRMSRIVVYAMLACYAVIAAILLMGCYFLFSALS